MTAREMVKVRLAPTLGSSMGRLELTRGVQAMGDRLVDGVVYREGAICPQPDWRPVRDGELAEVVAYEMGPPGSTVDIAPAPAAFVDAIRACGLVGGMTEQQYAAFVRQPAYQAALEGALPQLWQFVQSADGLQVLGTSVQGGDLWSTTTHADAGEPNRLSGLHIDNWDQLPLGERGRARRQLCINLGIEDRFFVFARAEVATIVGVLGESFERRQAYIGVGRVFFARFPDAAIVRVRVRPGEMYIAPTDNLLHDGSTVGSHSPDITLNLRGFFHVV
ncbi:MAG: hypothetical protein M3680_00160 [Myxococcota bacterium]|nr:hypothetical protein [Myxococcota bacterium]